MLKFFRIIDSPLIQMTIEIITLALAIYAIYRLEYYIGEFWHYITHINKKEFHTG